MIARVSAQALATLVATARASEMVHRPIEWEPAASESYYILYIFGPDDGWIRCLAIPFTGEFVALPLDIPEKIYRRLDALATTEVESLACKYLQSARIVPLTAEDQARWEAVIRRRAAADLIDP